MEELLEKYSQYRQYLRESYKSERDYLNLKDFMEWLKEGIVWHD